MMFYSNCLIQALKHKLKDWKHVKLTVIPPQYNVIFCPHILWSDGKADYEFCTSDALKWYQLFWFKGRIRERSLGWNKRYKEYIIALKKRGAQHSEFFGDGQ